jgi:ring-1,2-phenylacetyl-CoA epoxidase subunit PaaE
MSNQFHELKVKKLIRQTSDAVSVYFDIPANLNSTFDYKAGQFITLRLDVNGEDIRRAYSLFTSPSDSEFAVMVKEVSGGKLSPFINSKLQTGDFIKVMPPTGKFTCDTNPENSKNYVFFAGGSGITPIFSIIKSILTIEKNSTITLLYANRENESIIFADELNILEKDFESFNLFHILENPEKSKPSFKGLISSARVGGLLSEMGVASIENREYYTCGPGPMMSAIKQGLIDLGVGSNKIHSESFTVEGGGRDGGDGKRGGDFVGGGDFSNLKLKEPAKLTLQIYGEEHNIEIDPEETVTTAALRARLDPPFSCQIGACSTCIAKLEEGEVEMECSDALTQDEIDEGYVLTCTSRPTTEKIVINFDY